MVKKRAALARAHQVVVTLLEKQIDEQAFLTMVNIYENEIGYIYIQFTLSQLSQIGPDNYADVVEERHINKLCGYPLCDRAVEK